MERSLRIEGFRNIGFNNGKMYKERLIINNSLNKGELGDLIILIGANNSGKSNVLDALHIFGNSQITERDVTDLYMEEESRIPKLTLFARKNGVKEDDFAYKKTYAQNDEIVFPKENLPKRCQYITAENILSNLHDLYLFQQKYIGGSYLHNLYNSITSSYKNGISENNLQEVRDKIFSVLDSNQKFDEWDLYPELERNVIMKEYVVTRNITISDKKIAINFNYDQNYGYGFIPKILNYKNYDITNTNLITDYNGLLSSKFFIAVLKSIDIDISTIKNAYDTFHKQKNIGILIQKGKELNEKLKAVAEKFNKLYFIEDAIYSFNIYLESEKIFFSLFRGDQTISLDYQSTGFRWFFNLFFNLLNSTDLSPGDIIIMDEPATNLHVKGQRELRVFLKEFAIRNDITIVIATHSPFLIDLDYLDELRVVVNKDNISSIENNFAAVNENDPDSLLPIKEALTVENRILVNPDEKVIFVEGITDYNYLTAFKKLFDKTGIIFLPINGIGKTKEDCIKISQRLMKIRKKDPILLVDNDKAGNCIKEVNKDNKDFTIISLSDVDSNFKTIESLFSKEDLTKFGLIDTEGKFIKHSSTSTIFKNNVLKKINEISDETKKNFTNLFDFIFLKTE